MNGLDSMEDCIDYILARRKGFDPQQTLQGIVQKEQQLLAERVNAAVQYLTESQNEDKQELDEIVDMISSVDVLETANNQATRIENKVEETERESARLSEVLANGQKELEEKKQQRDTARKTLQAYRAELQRSSPAEAISVLHQLGEQAARKMSGVPDQKSSSSTSGGW